MPKKSNIVYPQPRLPNAKGGKAAYLKERVGIYFPDTKTTLKGALNRFASPWTGQQALMATDRNGGCDPSKFPCYRPFMDDNGDGSAASRKRGSGLNPSDPLGFLKG